VCRSLQMRSQSHASTVETMEGEHRAAAEAAVHAAAAHWEEVEATAKLAVDKAAVDLQAAEAAASKQLADAKAAAEQAAGIAAEVADKAQSSALVTQSSEMKAEVEVVADKEGFARRWWGSVRRSPVGRPGSGGPREKGLWPGSGAWRGPAIGVGR
jgi:hypothetical protein